MCWDSDLDLQGHIVEDLEDEVLHRLPAQAVQAAAEPWHSQTADAVGGEALTQGHERGLEARQRRLVAVLAFGHQVVDVAPVALQDADIADIDALTAQVFQAPKLLLEGGSDPGAHLQVPGDAVAERPIRADVEEVAALLPHDALLALLCGRCLGVGPVVLW